MVVLHRLSHWIDTTRLSRWIMTTPEWQLLLIAYACTALFAYGFYRWMFWYFG